MSVGLLAVAVLSTSGAVTTRQHVTTRTTDPAVVPVRLRSPAWATKREIMWGADDEESRTAKAAVQAAAADATMNIKGMFGRLFGSSTSQRFTAAGATVTREGNLGQDVAGKPVEVVDGVIEAVAEVEDAHPHDQPQLTVANPIAMDTAEIIDVFDNRLGGDDRQLGDPTAAVIDNPTPASDPPPEGSGVWDPPPVPSALGPLRGMGRLLLAVGVLAQLLEYGLGLFARDLVAGLAAAVACLAVLFPVEALKTRQQLQAIQLSTGQLSSQLPALYRGWLFGVLRDGPASGVSVAVFYLICRAWQPASLRAGQQWGFFASAVALAIGTALGAPLRVPFELSTRRIQAGLPAHNGVQPQGPLLVATWTVLLAREVPYALLQLGLFHLLLAHCGVVTLAHRVCCALLAGAWAGLLTAPFDVLTTCLATASGEAPALEPQPFLGQVGRHLREAGRAAWQAGGVAAFWAGGLLRMALAAPGTGLFFAVVEVVRAAL